MDESIFTELRRALKADPWPLFVGAVTAMGMVLAILAIITFARCAG